MNISKTLNYLQDPLRTLSILRHAKDGSNERMTTIKDIRRDNLRLLIEEAGRPKDLADRLGHATQSYLSQLLSDATDRHVGDKFARELEAAMGKPEGWMDVSHRKMDEVSTLAEAIERLAVLIEGSSRETVEAIVRALLDKQPGNSITDGAGNSIFTEMRGKKAKKAEPNNQ